MFYTSRTINNASGCGVENANVFAVKALFWVKEFGRLLSPDTITWSHQVGGDCASPYREMITRWKQVSHRNCDNRRVCGGFVGEAAAHPPPPPSVSEDNVNPLQFSQSFQHLTIAHLICRLRSHDVDMDLIPNVTREALQVMLASHLSNGFCADGMSDPAGVRSTLRMNPWRVVICLWQVNSSWYRVICCDCSAA